MKTFRIALVALLLAASSLPLLRGDMPAVQSGQWAATGAMSNARGGASAALLPSGLVLVTGGTGTSGVLPTAELFGPDGQFTAAGTMLSARADHASVVLADGRVLVVGGRTSASAVAAGETFGGSGWSAAGQLTDARWGHTATLLADGRVLIVGGENEAGLVGSVETFDPATGQFAVAGTLTSPRKGHAAARLADGRVVIAGGFSGAALNSINIFDPSTGSISVGPSLAIARAGLSATTLLDGTVLFFGGNEGTNDLASAEVFDPVAGTVTGTASAATARRDHQAFLLPNNNSVLIVGGASGGAAVASAELYVPWVGQFRATGSMAAARTHATGSALSRDGLLLVAGGDGVATSETYGFATIKTDKDDYAPGTTVTMTGTGWQPGETVTLSMVESPLLDTHPLVPVVADANGNISSAEFVPDEHDIGIRFYLTARGAASQAQTTFWDNKGLTINFAGTGAGSVAVTDTTVSSSNTTCTTGAPCNLSLGNNDVGTLTATASLGSAFAGWSSQSAGVTGCVGGTCNFAMGNNSQNVTAAFTLLATKLVFTTSAQTLTAGVTSGLITLQRQNASNVPQTAGSTIVTLATSSGGGIFRDAADTTPITSVTIPDGTSSASFLYKDTLAGTPNLTASATNLTSAAQVETVNPAAASKLAFSQQPSTRVAGQTITPAVTVVIQDEFGNRTPNTANVTITIGNNAGSGTLSGTSTVAAVTGLATFADLSIDKAGTGYTLSATSGALTPATSTAFNITVAAASQLAFSVQPSTTVAGASITPGVKVQIQDQFGNLISSTASVTVAIGNNAGGGTLSGTTTVAAVAGVATFGNLSINKIGNGYTLSASSASLTGTTSTSFDITPGAATKLAFSVQPGATVAGAAISPAVVVQVQDANNNVVTTGTGSTASISLAIGANPGTGTLTGGGAVAAVNGVATFSALSINKTGTGYTLSAAATGPPVLTGTTSTAFNITAGAADRLAFGVQPTNTVAGSAITPAVTVQVQDANGNVVTTGAASTTSITVAIGTNPGTGTLGGTTTLAATAGAATFSTLSINKTGTGYTLAALGGSLTGATSSAFNITPGAASKLAFGVQPSDAVAGASIAPAVTVQVQDANGNLVTGSTASLSLTIGTNPGGGVLTGGGTVSAVGGVATFSGLSINKIGTGYALTASPTPPSLTPATSGAFNITPGPAAKLVFTTTAQTLAAGVTSGTITVQRQDALSNATISGPLTVNLSTSSSGGTFRDAGDTTTIAQVAVADGSSNASFKYLDTLAGTPTVTAASAGLTNATQAEMINPGAAVVLVVAGYVSPTLAAASHTFTVTAKDALANTATGYTGTVHFTSSDGAAALPANYPFVAGDNGAHTFNATFNSGGPQSLTATDTVTATIAGTQSGIVVNKPAAITSANIATFLLNTAGSFLVTTTGFPVPAVAETGALPAGVSYVDNHDGTGTLSGTPTVTGASNLTFTASNGIGSNASQPFVLTVGQAPAITSANNTAFAVSAAGSFTVTTTGFPVSAISRTGALPGGVTFTDNANGTATLAGTPALGSAGPYALAIKASNGIGTDATQSFTLTVNKGTLTFDALSASQTITYGTPTISFTGRVSPNAPPMLTGTVTATVGGASIGPLNLNGNQNNFSGTLATGTIPASATPYAITYTYSGNGDFNPATDISTTLTVNKGTPTLAWTPNPLGPITYGTTLAARLTATSGSVVGSFSYANGPTPVTPATVLNASPTPYALTATFTPTDTTNYVSGGTVTNSLTVNKATPTLTWTPLGPITYGTSLTGLLNADSGSVPGSFSYANGATPVTAATVLNASTTPYTLTATFTPTDTTNYASAGTVTNTLSVNKATPTLSWTNPLGPITYGATLTGLLNATSGSVAGNFSYANGAAPVTAATVLNASATAYTLTATFTPADATNYASGGTVTNNLTVNKATPTVSWSNPGDIIYGTLLSATQLNATASVPGAFTYNPAAGTKLNAGNQQTLSVSLTPTDGDNYNSVPATTVKINVLKATPALTWTTPADITYGTLLSATQLNATADVEGGFTYSPIAATKLSAGNNQDLAVSFTPADTVNYNGANKTVKIDVLKATPALTWTTPADITYGTLLNATQLNATADVEGGFTYSPIAATKLSAGNNQDLAVSFTPADTVNYNGANKTVKIDVLKATPVLTWTTPADITYGTLLSATQLNATADVEGGFTYSPIAATKLSAGNNQDLAVSFAPTDTVNYNGANKTVKINVLKATPVLMWTTPADITYGTLLSAAQLNATADVEGGFTYGPIAGTKLSAGNNQDLSVSFTPADTINYKGANKTVKINVLRATPTVSWSNPGDIIYGTLLSATQLNATASLPGAFVYTPAADTKLTAGNEQTLSVSFAPDDTTNYNGVPATTVKINVLRATPTLSWNNPADITYGAALSGTELNATASVAGSFTYNPAAGTGLSAGNQQTLSVSFAPTDTVNYNGANKTVKINVLQATLTASIVGDPTKVYNGNTNATLNTVNFSVSGFVPGQSVTVTQTSGVYNSAFVSTATAVTTSLAPGDFTPAASTVLSNYTLPTMATGPGHITPATLTYVSDPKTRAYGAANPLLTGTVTGYVNGENLTTATTGTLAFVTTASAAATSNVGSYAITGSGLTAKCGNYAFVQAAGNVTAFTVTPASLTYTATANTRPYGAPDPPFTGTVTGFAYGQTQTATTGTLIFSTTATITSNVGSYPINGFGLTANYGNYTFVQAAANATALTITKANQTIALAPLVNRTFNDPPFTVTATATSGLPVAFTAGPSLICTAAGNTITIVDVGDCTVTGSQLGNNNYFAAPAVSQKFTVNPKLSLPPATTGIYYTGPSIYWTTSSSTSTATVFLSATVLDSCSRSIPADMRPAGCTVADIRKAKVSFVLFDPITNTETAITGATNLPVGLVNADDLSTGTAATSFQYNLGSKTYEPLTFKVKIGGAYADWSPAHTLVTVAVAKPTGGNLVMGAGAGFVNSSNSAGILKPFEGERTEVLFNLTYTKNLKDPTNPSNPQGQVVVKVVSDRNRDGVVDGVTHTYLFKSNAISTLQMIQKQGLMGTDTASTKCQAATIDPANYEPAAPPDLGKCYDIAVFTAKANVQELTPTGAVSVDGGALMQFSVTDGDIANLGTGSANATLGDYLGVQVDNTKIGGVWISSFWDLTKTRQTAVGGGSGKPDVIVQ